MKVRFRLRDGSVIVIEKSDVTLNEMTDLFSDLLGEETHQSDVIVLKPKGDDAVLVRVADILSVEIRS